MSKSDFESLIFINKIRSNGVIRCKLPEQLIAILQMQKLEILNTFYDTK